MLQKPQKTYELPAPLEWGVVVDKEVGKIRRKKGWVFEKQLNPLLEEKSRGW